MTFRLNTTPLRADRWKPTTRTPQQRRPRKIGSGPATFSASLTLDRQPFVWDTNQLYARLGLPTDATRVEIARAYLDLDGYLSYRLTYAFAMLVNKEMRRRYDATPLGAMWSNDPDLSVAITLDRFERTHDDGGWAHYLDADLDVTPLEFNAEVWRSALTEALAGTELDGTMLCVGATATDPRLAVLGYNLVIFVIVDIDNVPAYARGVASELLAMTTNSTTTRPT